MANQPGKQEVGGDKPKPVLPKCKLLEKMRSNPKNDWGINDVETLCNQVGLTCSKPSSGSHFKVSSSYLDGILPIPAKRPIKAAYIKHLVALADAHRNVDPEKNDD